MISCKEFVTTYKADLKRMIAENNNDISLKIIQVGDNPASNKYVAGKIKDCAEAGIKCWYEKLPLQCTTNDVCNAMNGFYSGIIVQLPLPEHIDKNEVISSIPNHSDVDGFKSGTTFNPCTAQGILMWLNYNQISLKGKNAVVIGRSDIVGKPMAKLLLENDCTVTICHSHTKDLSEYTKNADVIIVAAGKQNLLTADMLSPNKKPIIIDVGINVDSDGKLHGDCDYDNLVDKCEYITPVPGGVGLLTRCALLHNTFEAAMRGTS